jgi:transposase
MRPRPATKRQAELGRHQHQGALIADFAASLNPTCFVVCEATGGYERDLLAALIAAGVPAHRADARKSLPSGLTRG